MFWEVIPELTRDPMDRFEAPDKRWRRVKDWIIRQIDSGEWPARTKLPSIRTLARLFDTSITTVQRALADLEANAYVLTEPRVGYFVSAAGRASPASRFDFSSVTVNVNHAVVAMLSQAASRTTLSLSSAVLHGDLTPTCCSTSAWPHWPARPTWQSPGW
jgi:DNA-binding GntR family transcriptional regulator